MSRKNSEVNLLVRQLIKQNKIKSAGNAQYFMSATRFVIIDESNINQVIHMLKSNKESKTPRVNGETISDILKIKDEIVKRIKNDLIGVILIPLIITSFFECGTAAVIAEGQGGLRGAIVGTIVSAICLELLMLE